MEKKKLNKKVKQKYLIIPVTISIIFIALCLLSLKFDIVSLMSNSVYETINIKERDKYTLEDDNVSVCTSTNSNVVTAQTIRGKCVLTGISKGQTDVGLFIADDGINQKTYNVVVNSYANISQRTKWSSKTVIFRVDTNNMSNLNFKYCYSRNGECNQTNVNGGHIVGNEIRFNRIAKSYKRVCLYAYDNGLVASMCVDRGMFGIFW